MLFGRRTYEGFASFWPHQTDNNPFTAYLNSVTKYVVSNTLTEPVPWQNSILLSGDPAAGVARLKETDGPNLSITGSGQLVQRCWPPAWSTSSSYSSTRCSWDPPAAVHRGQRLRRARPGREHQHDQGRGDVSLPASDQLGRRRQTVGPSPCTSIQCGLCIRPRMLPKGRGPIPVTNPASRTTIGS